MKDNWTRVVLSDYVDLKHGYQFRDTDFTENGIPIIKIGNVWERGLDLENVSFISKKRYEIFKSYQIYNGDILMSLTGNIGRVVEVKNLSEVVLQNYRVGNFYSKDESVLEKHFIRWILGSRALLKQLEQYSNQSAQANFGKQDLDKLKFNLPPLPQQKEIAKILSTVDNVIEKTESAIAKYQAIKQGLMHDLFTRGIDVKTGQLRPTPQEAPELYKESVLGLIPRDWNLDALENIANYVDYRGKTPPKSDKGIYLITAKNIKFGFIDYEISQEYILKSSYKATMSRGIPELGDVLITTEAPLGNIAQIDIEGLALAQRVIKYRCVENEMLNDFLKHSMMAAYFQKELEAESTGSTVKGIKGSRLHKLEVFKPQIDEQNSIVQGLKPIESKIQTEQQALAKYQQLKAGLLQDLLTGKVAVGVE